LEKGTLREVKKERKRAGFVSYLIFCSIGIALFLNVQGCSKKEEPAETEKRSTESSAEVLKPEDLEVKDLSFSWSPDNLFCYVTGKIVNKTNRHISSARVVVEFYNDQNEKIGEEKNQIQNIAAKGSGTGGYGGANEFKLTTQPGIDRAKLKSVKLKIEYVFTY
jgi:hypothetical protein